MSTQEAAARLTGPPVALTIAGSDSGGGAGIQADLKVFAVTGVWGTTALTAVTAQNTEGVRSTYALPGEVVRAQIDAVAADLSPAATKTGMLASAAVARVVAAALAEHRIVNVVVDPVFASSHGDELGGPEVVAVLRRDLLPLATVVTPNLDEAEALTGHAVRTTKDMEEAAEEIAAAGPEAVLLTGGHLGGERSPDLLWSVRGAEWLDGDRLHVRATHGTGCTLSAGVCAYLAKGRTVRDACLAAKDLVTTAIGHGHDIGRGTGPVDPAWRAMDNAGD